MSELAAAEAAVEEVRGLRRDRSDDDEHDPEGTPLSAEWSRLEGMRRVARHRLTEIDSALARFDGGSYGICVSCGRPIAAGRLEALPAATHCVHCAGRTRRP